jgi:bifunctional non-homologous end joining protein LigD
VRPLVMATGSINTYGAILDGEVAILTPEGHSDFHALEKALKRGGADRMVYYVFDILYLDGLDLRGAALIDRKEILLELLAVVKHPIIYSEHLEGDARKVWTHACDMELEGVVSKRMDARYISGRNSNWLKTPCRHRDTFVIAGWAEKQGKFDGLYLAREEGGKLRYAGKLETGFSASDNKLLLARLKPLRTPRPHMTATRAKFPKAKWVRPAVLVDAEYRGTTGDGLLRHPSFKGVREDLV